MFANMHSAPITYSKEGEAGGVKILLMATLVTSNPIRDWRGLR